MSWKRTRGRRTQGPALWLKHRARRQRAGSGRGRIKTWTIGLAALGSGLAIRRWWRSRRSTRLSEHSLPGLSAPVTITFDRSGIPRIDGKSRVDVIRALGFVTARDRLFQMDLIRRMTAGRLSEIMGRATVEMDTEQRIKGFNRTAQAIVGQLPGDQRALLQAYTDGVNAYLSRMKIPPFECLALRYRPEPWTLVDSILPCLYMLQSLTEDEILRERSLTIMQQTLPPEVVAFLTPDDDRYANVLIGGSESHRPQQPIPVEALRALVREAGAGQQPVPIQQDAVKGSNGWAVAGTKTRSGTAMLANDLHLALSVPNVWYRASLSYGTSKISGVVLPGCPLIIAGSNSSVAWGFTNALSDVLDLVKLEVDPRDATRYRTAQGWQQFEVITERIQVKGSEDVPVEVRQTCWGPVMRQSLLDQPVALHWTALDPQAVDIGLMHMEDVQTLDAAIDVMQRYSGPPMNVLLADATGRIAWTYCGKIPIRHGFDGSTSQSWADDKLGWRGYIPPAELPRVIDPPSGYLASANNRAVGKEYPYVLGHNYPSSYRVHRISERLEEMQQIEERDMLALQLDTTSTFFERYRSLVLGLLTDDVTAGRPMLADARHEIAAWDGTMSPTSRGIALLADFRMALTVEVFKPYLHPCQQADPSFIYYWFNLDTPLLQLLDAQIPGTQPEPERYPTWHAFLIALLERSMENLRARFRVRSLAELPWGRANTVSVAHPLAQAAPPLGKLLNMPRTAQAGGEFCILVTGVMGWVLYGPTMRMVVAPSQEEAAILHMPCGQSGNPWSRNYRDQHQAWLTGQPLPLLPGPTQRTLRLAPESPSS